MIYIDSLYTFLQPEIEAIFLRQLRTYMIYVAFPDIPSSSLTSIYHNIFCSNQAYFLR